MHAPARTPPMQSSTARQGMRPTGAGQEAAAVQADEMDAILGLLVGCDLHGL